MNTLIPVNPSQVEPKNGFVVVYGVYKKIKKAFKTVDGLYNLVWSNAVDVATMGISYSGNMTDQVVTMSGKQYRLLTLTSTGTLTLEDTINAEVWFCNGGYNGSEATGSSGMRYGGNGGNGGYVRRKYGISAKTAIVTIGAGNGGATSLNIDGSTISAETFRPPQGGMGATNTTDGNQGAGAAYSIVPFEDSYFTSYPCGGGGGGSANNTSTKSKAGGSGGSNTSSGQPTGYQGGGNGGATGGGNGGGSGDTDASVLNGKNASYYGSGGGGGGMRSYYVGLGGAGYQGICYIRIPLEQSA